MTPAALVDAVRSQSAAERFAVSGAGDGAVLLDLSPGTPVPADKMEWSSLPFVVIGLGRSGYEDEDIPPMWRDLLDVVLDPDGRDVELLEATINSNPIAATTLALTLRYSERRTAGEGLVIESAAYSTLQGGPEFARWRLDHPVRHRADNDRPRVRCTRNANDLEITLTRPQARNALDAAMRDALNEALVVATLDSDISRIDLRGEGPSFCAGGDLNEMGQRSDPASAHLLRLHRSPARLLATLADRTTAHLHGACAGSGIELPAFAHQIMAASDTTFALPELGLGLIPGAGGTVSLPARIGRHRTAWLALTGQAIDAPTAVSWGLADKVVEL